ncbi:hypothetical protein K2P97_00255 [bacterium]|nr:hypothetical protein [bacterium]
MNKVKKDAPRIYEIGFPLNDEFETSVFEYLLKNRRSEKVVRIFERNRKLRSLNDPMQAHRLEERAAFLGVSLDTLLNRYLHHVIEMALNKSKNPNQILSEIYLNNWLDREEDVFILNGLYQIYKFRKMEFEFTENGNPCIFKKDDFLELTLTLPKFLMSKFLIYFETSAQWSFQKFIEKVFSEFLNANNLDFKSKNYQASDLEKLIHKIGSIEKWQPYGFLSPPIYHSQESLDNDFLCFSYLSKNPTSAASAHVSSRITKRITLKDTSKHGFDPFRELIYYISNRLWRSPGELISILVMCKYRDWDRESFVFDRIIDRSKINRELRIALDEKDLSMKAFITSVMS